MATLKQRLHRKNASGTFDAVHLETSSDLVLRPSGNTVEKDLATFQTDINSLKTSVSSGKAAIASAVTDKGVQTAADATFSTMANNIRNIKSAPASIQIELNFYRGSNPTSPDVIVMYTSASGQYGKTTFSRSGSKRTINVISGSAIIVGITNSSVRWGVTVKILSGTGTVRGCPLGTSVINIITMTANGSIQFTARAGGLP